MPTTLPFIGPSEPKLLCTLTTRQQSRTIYLASTGKIPDGCCVASLQTVNIIRKYLSVLEVPISWLCPSDFSFLIGSKEYKQAKRAMLCHHSQLLWFRHLYLLLSRYMFINTFQVITQDKKDLKIF
ncbi:N-acetylglucosaminyl-phosphatidylinositol de-N-acetylase [Megalops cyprinoides]|uniref:N-acetylglucosaminyl-phosphatidylinositol de-N-acetylase n=1 Tax=Megalops cyprinoides TaxID=118141 RepID=UPI0018643EC5|nr:N-acetylglucosaminyl-phosphatidylinositol de-N-acetylase [Megalops cyprinoides]